MTELPAHQQRKRKDSVRPTDSSTCPAGSVCKRYHHSGGRGTTLWSCSSAAFCASCVCLCCLPLPPPPPPSSCSRAKSLLRALPPACLLRAIPSSPPFTVRSSADVAHLAVEERKAKQQGSARVRASAGGHALGGVFASVRAPDAGSGDAGCAKGAAPSAAQSLGLTRSA